jgi:cellulose synthase/poly-beta-1,6-N-acetylglucosamine synthase-like glycosyltransferase
LTGKSSVKFEPLTIGTPFFNSEWCINKYFDSILNLDYPKKLLDLILVDNGSSDNTYRLLKHFCKSYSKKYRRIQVLEKKNRVKHTKAFLTTAWNAALVRNLIVDNTGSEDIIFVDSDCLIPPYSIKRLIGGAEMGGDIIGGITVMKLKVKHPTITAFTYTESGIGANIGLINEKIPLTLLLPAWLFGKRWLVTVVGTGLSYYKRKVLDKVKFELDPEINEDVNLCTRANELGFRVVADFGLWYEHLPLKYEILDIPDVRWKLLVYLPIEKPSRY